MIGAAVLLIALAIYGVGYWAGRTVRLATPLDQIPSTAAFGPAALDEVRAIMGGKTPRRPLKFTSPALPMFVPDEYERFHDTSPPPRMPGEPIHAYMARLGPDHPQRHQRQPGESYGDYHERLLTQATAR